MKRFVTRPVVRPVVRLVCGEAGRADRGSSPYQQQSWRPKTAGGVSGSRVGVEAVERVTWYSLDTPEVGRKVQILAKKGHPFEDLANGLDSVLNLPFSTNTQEQQHVSLSVGCVSIAFPKEVRPKFKKAKKRIVDE